jgi:hypothetical protein
MEFRVAALERTTERHGVQIDDLEREQLRTRDRLHEMSKDRESIQLLASDLMNFLRDRESMMERTVELVLRKRREQAREGWKYWIGWASFAATVAVLLAEHYEIFTRLLYHS